LVTADESREKRKKEEESKKRKARSKSVAEFTFQAVLRDDRFSCI